MQSDWVCSLSKILTPNRLAAVVIAGKLAGIRISKISVTEPPPSVTKGWYGKEGLPNVTETLGLNDGKAPASHEGDFEPGLEY